MRGFLLIVPEVWLPIAVEMAGRRGIFAGRTAIGIFPANGLYLGQHIAATPAPGASAAFWPGQVGAARKPRPATVGQRCNRIVSLAMLFPDDPAQEFLPAVDDDAPFVDLDSRRECIVISDGRQKVWNGSCD